MAQAQRRLEMGEEAVEPVLVLRPERAGGAAAVKADCAEVAVRQRKAGTDKMEGVEVDARVVVPDFRPLELGRRHVVVSEDGPVRRPLPIRPRGSTR